MVAGGLASAASGDESAASDGGGGEEENVYDFVTFGAPSAHVLKFKGGGVRRRRRVVRELRCGDFDEKRFIEENARPSPPAQTSHA